MRQLPSLQLPVIDASMNTKLQIHEIGELFEAVQMNSIYPDGKTFPDCIAKKSLNEIQLEYSQQKNTPGFNLREFVQSKFDLPLIHEKAYQTSSTSNIDQHITQLWKFLTRQSSAEESSLIQLPKPYVVPGGRFREIYYWDSYFTMLGLLKSDRRDLAINMVDNFSYLIDSIGYIPNGNRTYFVGRSQPPFFSLMVKVVAEQQEDLLEKYLNSLNKEYFFWMQDSDGLRPDEAAHRIVKLPDGSLLNRYWDANDTPRPESFKEDVELSRQSSQKSSELFRNLRAAAESGWDFSSRWFKEGGDFSTTHTTDILPVDLNCLLMHLEQTISDAYRYAGNKSKADSFLAIARQRKATIRKYCWNDELKFYFDYDFKSKKLKTSFTLAGFFPLFFEVATPTQVEEIASHLKSKFLKPGGLTTTLIQSGQQWDAPNGWAPLQWICFKGLLNYGFDDLANEVKSRWLKTNEAVFRKTGKLTEKYDVWNENADASGGEYPNQDGFGWTNGVYLAMKS